MSASQVPEQQVVPRKSEGCDFSCLISDFSPGQWEPGLSRSEGHPHFHHLATQTEGWLGCYWQAGLDCGASEALPGDLATTWGTHETSPEIAA